MSYYSGRGRPVLSYRNRCLNVVASFYLCMSTQSRPAQDTSERVRHVPYHVIVKLG